MPWAARIPTRPGPGNRSRTGRPAPGRPSPSHDGVGLGRGAALVAGVATYPQKSYAVIRFENAPVNRFRCLFSAIAKGSSPAISILQVKELVYS